MKKLTAGIFTVLMGLVTVNAAEAAVASKGYVDEKVGGATTAVETLQQTVVANKLAAEKLVSDYKTENDAKVNANTAAIAENAADILANTGLISDNADAIAANTEAINNEKTAREQADTALDTRLVEVEKFSGTGEGSVAKQIADAVAGETSAREAADTALDTSLKAYADQAEVDAISAAGTAADSKIATALADYSTTTEMNTAITNANDAQTATITDAYEAADATLQGNIDTLSGTVSSNKTAADTGIQEAKAAAAAASTAAAQALTDAKAYADQEDAKIETKIGNVAEGKTVVQMIEAAQEAATYDDTEVRGLISAEETARTEADAAINTKIGTIADGKTVSGLISDNAAAIATKLTDTTTISEDGKYVLTAVTVGDDTTYAWELITRETGTEQE